MHGFSALFGALLGFLAAVAPDLLQMLRDRFSHKRELERREQELNAVKEGYEYTIHNLNDVTASQAQQIETLQLQLQDAADSSNDDIKGHVLLLFLRSSVRPILTYGFFLVFATIKLLALHHGFMEHVPIPQLLNVVWDEDAESLFAAVISFWFGSRMFNSRQKESRDEKTVSPSIKGTGRIVGE